MSFCTAINCMDGRVQLPVIRFLQERFKSQYVDVISEPGPNLLLAVRTKPYLLESIFDRLRISVEIHESTGIAVVGHHGCAGNPAPKDRQINHLRDAVAHVRSRYKGIEIIALWVDENWKVNEINFRS